MIQPFVISAVCLPLLGHIKSTGGLACLYGSEGRLTGSGGLLWFPMVDGGELLVNGSCGRCNLGFKLWWCLLLRLSLEMVASEEVSANLMSFFLPSDGGVCRENI